MHESLADIIADVTANAIEAGAKTIRLSVEEGDGRISLTVADDGKGMPPEIVARAFDPFYTESGKHAGRSVGLGLPFVKQTCEACGGTVKLTSQPGVGTTLVCSFDATSIDLPPMGDLVSTLLGLFNYPGAFELVFTRRKGSQGYAVARSELAEAVGSFATVAGLSLAKEFLASQEAAL